MINWQLTIPWQLRWEECKERCQQRCCSRDDLFVVMIIMMMIIVMMITVMIIIMMIMMMMMIVMMITITIIIMIDNDDDDEMTRNPSHHAPRKPGSPSVRPSLIYCRQSNWYWNVLNCFKGSIYLYFDKQKPQQHTPHHNHDDDL